MEIGTQIIQKNNLEKLCLSLSQINIRYIELGPEVLASLSLEQVTKLSRLFRKQGIRVYSVHAPYGDKADLCALEERKRKKAIVSHKKIMNMMREFNSSILVVHPGDKTEKENVHHRLNLLYNSLEELILCAKENKIILAVENMPPGFPGDSAQELKRMLEEINSPYVGICFDTGHSHIGGALREDFKTLQPYIVTFHIHDNDGVRDLHLQPPYGTIPWEGFVRELTSTSSQNPLIMECFPWGKVDFEWVKREIELLFGGKLIKNVLSPHGYIRCPSCGHFFFEDNGNTVCYCSFKGSSNSYIMDP
ncbi:sugar phosphate isomerase/epimerase [Candidatus Aerophobetes bacterium]|nr:sugar phosphate isomerase/epimerase [Candidatus Aerophobetes bacterium]